MSRKKNRLCEVPGCGKPHSAKGMCNAHYLRLYMHGRLELLPSRRVPVHDRIRRRIAVTAAGCWVYQGRLTPKGYAHVTVVHGQKRFAHVLMYEEKYGPKPAGTDLDHLCRNRACCNPDHLEPVPHATNVNRGLVAAVNRSSNIYDPVTRRIVGRKKLAITRSPE